MAASVSIQEGSGASVTWTTVTTARFATYDSYNPGNSYPVVIPTSGTNRSFWKHFRLAFSGTFTQLSNFRVYSGQDIKSGWSPGTGGGVFIALRDAGDHGCPAANYDQAVGVVGETGYDIKDATYGHDYYKDQTAALADLDNYSSASPLTFDSSVYTTAGATKAIVLQLHVKPDGVQGEKPNRTITIRYDEI